jgi:DNA-binding NarL/FixJ family response regulator
MASLKLVIADDQALFRKGLCSLLRSEQPNWTVYETPKNDEVLKLLRTGKFNVVVVNIGPGVQSLKLSNDIRKQFPDIKILLLMVYMEPTFILQAIRSGVNGVLPIASEPEELMTAIRLVHYEGNYFGGSVEKAYQSAMISELSSVKLDFSNNEQKILELLSIGNNTKEISEVLGLTPFTVDSYRKKLLQKTHTKNVAHLISMMYRTGIL